MIKKLFKHSFIYGLGSVSLQLTNFLLIPLYVKYLTPAEFGVQALFVMLGVVLFICIDLGIKTSINRVYFDYKSDIEKKIFTANAFIALNVLGLVIVFICLAFTDSITLLITGSINYTKLYTYVIWTVFFNSTFNLFLSFLRVKNLPYRFVIFSVSILISTLALTIYFVAVRNEGLLGIFKSNLIISAIAFIVIFPFILKEIKVVINTKMIRNMLSFGLPFVPVSIFSFILTSSDRYLLKIFSELDEVGLYAMGYRVGLAINVFVVTPFVLAWPQQIVPISQKENAKEIFSRIVTYFIATSGFITLLLLIFLDNIYNMFLTTNYFASKSIVSLITISYLFNGMYHIFLVGAFLEKKTKFIPIIFAFASFLNVGLNFYFIPRWGMAGAAMTTFIAYLTIPILTYFISNKYYKINIEYLRIIKLLIVFSVIYLLSKELTYIGITQMIVLKTLLIISIPLLLYLVKFYEENEKREIARFCLQFKKLCKC